MAPSRIVLFGATGYTGRLVAERLVALGERPVLAGRSETRLAELAERLGGLETVRADVVRQNSVFSMVHSGDVLVSTVGPFARWGGPAVRAAIAAGATYLDSTGEPAFIRRIFEEFGPAAERGGAALLTAMAFDYVPGALAGALALEAGGERAVRADVGYFAFGGGPAAFSAGTRESLVGAALAPNFAFRDGRVVAERPAARSRSFRAKGKDRPALSLGGAEHFTLPRAYPRLRETNVYLGAFGPLTRAAQAGTLAGSLAGRLPGVGGALRFAGSRAAALGGAPEPGTTSGGVTWVTGAAYDAGGLPLAEVSLAGPDPYAFTAALMAWAARRAAHQGVETVGALGPVDAFGLAALEAGCAGAGLTRVAAPAAPAAA